MTEVLGACWMASTSAHRRTGGTLLGDVPAGDLDVGLAVPRVSLAHEHSGAGR
jgi:hypothetical protein